MAGEKEKLRRGGVRHGAAWLGQAGHGKARTLLELVAVPRIVKARRGRARLGKAWHGTAWQGLF